MGEQAPVDVVGISMAFLAASGKVLFMTREFMIAADGWVQVRSDELYSQLSSVHESLRSAIRIAASPRSKASLIAVDRGRSRHVLLLKVFPVIAEGLSGTRAIGSVVLRRGNPGNHPGT